MQNTAVQLASHKMAATLHFIGEKRFELLKVDTIEFTAQPFLPIKGLSFFI